MESEPGPSAAAVTFADKRQLVRFWGQGYQEAGRSSSTKTRTRNGVGTTVSVMPAIFLAAWTIWGFEAR